MKYMNYLRERLHEVANCVRERLVQIRTGVRAWWAAHRDRLASESGYADAFVAVVLALVALITESDHVRYVVYELAAAYIAVIRAFRPDRGEAEDWQL